MSSYVFISEHSGSHIYRIGRAGFDSGSADTGGVYTGTLRTEKISPAGEDGLCYFRRVAVRIWHTGAFTTTVKVWVDGQRTKIYTAGTSTQGDQTVVISKAAPATSPFESVIEAGIKAQGTYIEIELSFASDSMTGVFLPESVEVHLIPIRESKSRTNAEST